MGMTDRQFDAYLVQLLARLKRALKENPDNEELKDIVADIEASLKRP